MGRMTLKIIMFLYPAGQGSSVLLSLSGQQYVTPTVAPVHGLDVF